MAAAWELDIPLTEKMVLLCLCDHANDSGHCWPSIARMAAKCSVSERTVQRAIKSLNDRGIVSWDDVPGRSHRFVIDPRHIVTPDTVSPLTMTTKPPTQCHPTPDTVSPKPSITIKQPSKNNKAQKPDGVCDAVWSDFQQLRKAKRAPLTETALAAIEREAAAAGWTLEAALSECSARGWQAFKAAWVKETTNGRTSPSNRNTAELALAKLGMAGG